MTTCDCCRKELDDSELCIACCTDSPPAQRLVPDPTWEGDAHRNDQVLVAVDAYRNLCRTCCACFVLMR